MNVNNEPLKCKNCAAPRTSRYECGYCGTVYEFRPIAEPALVEWHRDQFKAIIESCFRKPTLLERLLGR